MLSTQNDDQHNTDGKTPPIPIQSPERTITFTRSGWMACLPITCLGLILFNIAAIIVLSLIPLYTSTRDVVTVKQTNYNLKYELEPSLEVAVGRSVGTQIALVSGGPLNEKQRFLFQTAMQRKLQADPKTSIVKVVLQPSSGVASEGHCKIKIPKAAETVRRIRRQTSKLTTQGDIMTINQHKNASSSKTVITVACMMTCGGVCSNALVQYALDVVLSQLQFSTSSFINLFYSGSTASTVGGSSTILLPTISSSVNKDDLSNLQPSTRQTISYRPVYDKDATDDSYRAIVDYEFAVPSIVFDHSSQIFVMNLTSSIIVFGFNSVNAYAQALNWSSNATGVVFQGECLSTNAHDVYTLTGLIYDANALTVTANYTTSPISNNTNGGSVVIGGNTNGTATNNNSTSNSSKFDPQPYLANVTYISASFFTSSNNSAHLNTDYYANLNASSDTLFDDLGGCYFNSLSQALLYDIIDGSNYNDPDAYNDLASGFTSESTKSVAVSGRSYRTLEDFGNIFQFKNIKVDVMTSADHRYPLRRRRSLRLINAEKIRIRRRRGLLKWLGDATKPLSDAFKSVVPAIKKAGETVKQIGSVIKAAVAGGEVDGEKEFDISIQYDTSQSIFATESNGVSIAVDCEECDVEGHIRMYGKFNFEKDGVSTVMEEGYVEMSGNMFARAVVRVTLGASHDFDRNKEVASIPITPLIIPGVVSLGPSISLVVGVYAKLDAEFSATFGAHLTWDEIMVKVDLKSPSESSVTGWSPSQIEPQSSFDAKVELDLGVYVTPKLELSLIILNGVIKIAAGFASKLSVGYLIEASTGSSTCPGGLSLSPYIGIDISAFAEAKAAIVGDAETTHPIYDERFPMADTSCVGGQETTPSLV